MTKDAMLWSDGSELGETVKDIDEMMSAWLKAGLLDYEFVQRDTWLGSPNHKWRVTSAMQKAIRRGNVDTALEMANALHGFDWEYIWRRLPIIALEDIGVADIPLVCAIIWVSGKRVWRESNGSCLKYTYMLIERMAKSVKDRSVCDLVCWVEWDPHLEYRRKQLITNEQTGAGWLGPIMTDQNNSLSDRMLAAWGIAGTKKCRGDEGGVPPNIEGDFNELNELHYLQGIKMPLAVRMMVHAAGSKTGDGMPIAYPFIWQMAKDTWDSSPAFGNNPPFLRWEADDLVQLPMLGKFPSEAFDQHCREGKRAIRYVNKSCAPIVEFLTDQCQIPPADTKELTLARQLVTSILLFRVEGSQVDKRLVFNGSKDLFDMAELALNCSQGVPGKYNDYGMGLVRANMLSVQHARKVVLDMIPPGSVVHKPIGVWVSQLDGAKISESEEDAAIPPLQLTAPNSGEHADKQLAMADEMMKAMDAVAADKPKAPGHTDLMVSPEKLDDYLKQTVEGQPMSEIVDGVVNYSLQAKAVTPATVNKVLEVYAAFANAEAVAKKATKKKLIFKKKA